MGTSRLGSLLVEEGLLSEADRRTIKGTCGSHGPAFARSIIALGLLDEDELAAFLAEKTPWRVASKDLFADSEQGAWGVIDRPLLERLEVLPLKLVGQTLYVAMVDPLDQDTIKQLGFFSGYKIHPVISTLSHIRASLKKLLKDYEPASSQLEELISNHAVAAGRRLRLGDVKPGATKAALAEPVAAAQADEGDDFEIEETPAAPAPQPAVQAESAPAELEYPDSVNAAESADDDGEAAPAPANALSAEDAAAMMGDDPAGLDDLDGDLDGDFKADLGDLDGEGDLLAELDDAPKAAPAEKKPSSMAAAAAADDLEGLADLSEFDPDKAEGGDDLEADLSGDFDADLGGELKADVEAEAPTAAQPAAAAAVDDLLGDLEGDSALEAEPKVPRAAATDAGDLDLDFDSPAAPASPEAEQAIEELGAESATEALGDDLEEGLGDDLAGLAVEDNDLENIAVEPSSEPAIDGGELDFAAPAAEAAEGGDDADPLADLEGELAEPTPVVGDDLGGDPLAAMAEPEEDDPLGAAPAASVGEKATASLNRALLSLTMAKDLKDAVTRVAPALKEAGLSRGLLVESTKGQAKPLVSWEPGGDGATVKTDGLAAFVTPGLAQALGRQFAGWTAFDDATRDQNLKPFAKWSDAKHALRVAAVPAAGGKQLVVLASWDQTTREDAGVKSAALDLIRKIAAKA